ncbi:TA system antitoxin ParD family protein [Euzebya tangerina]|uniref:TA system antitoxin ParD family protein n=1 Tax=Euzebya tangerina TaxID=591198 RepID=UPI0013C31931|nr:hypothetical protein [Euzebya tangerina]
MATKPVRLDQSLVDAAAESGHRNRRSTTQQIDFWLRVGRAVSAGQTSERERIMGAVNGTVHFEELSDPEREIAHAEIDARIETAASGADFAARLAAEGVPTVTLGPDGALIRQEPDGSTSVIGDADAA